MLRVLENLSDIKNNEDNFHNLERKYYFHIFFHNLERNI